MKTQYPVNILNPMRDVQGNLLLKLHSYFILVVYCRAVRETFIKTKYVDKKFVKSLLQFEKSQLSPNRSSRLMEVRKWSVRKMRRRPRSVDRRKYMDKEAVRKIEQVPEVVECSSSSSKDDDTNSESSKRGSLKKRGSVLLFGNDLDKQPIDGPIDLSSDQESTGGEEDNETVGTYLCCFWGV